MGVIAAAWDELRQRVHERLQPDREDELLGRTWQALSAAEGNDSELIADLRQALAERPRSAALHNALGLVAALSGAKPPALVEPFRQAIAADPLHLVAALNLAEVLSELGDRELAVSCAGKVLTALDRIAVLSAAVLDAPSYPPGFNVLRVEWERAAWQNAGHPAAEAQAKHDLLRWRAHALLARWTGDLGHYREAALARPDLPATRAALGCALGRAGRAGEAVSHLRQAVTANPFDRMAARALFQALGEAGDTQGQEALATTRRLLVRAAPGVIPAEPWFAETARTGSERPATAGAVSEATSRVAPGGGSFALTWEGSQDEVQSLAVVNRQLCTLLIERGHELSLLAHDYPPAAGVPILPLSPTLTARLHAPLSRACEVHVRHRWPPDFTRPPSGQLVLMQPWEFGSLPRSWVGPIVENVAEVWAYTNAVRDCYVESGVPAERVHVVPLGVDSERFSARSAAVASEDTATLQAPVRRWHHSPQGI